MADALMVPGLDSSDSYEATMKHAFMQYQEKCRLLAAAEQEIALLREEVQRLQRGEGIVVVIEGKTFALASGPAHLHAASLIAPDLRDELSAHMAAIDGNWLNSAPHKHDTVALDGLDVFGSKEG